MACWTRVHLVCLLRGGGEGKVEKSLWLADHIVRVFTPQLIVIGQCTMHTVHLAQCSHVHVYHALLCNVHIAPGCCFCIVQLVGCVCRNLTFSSTLFRLLTFKYFLLWLKTEVKKHTTGFVIARLLGYWDIIKMRYFSKISPHWANQCKIWLYEMENSKQITNMQFINWHWMNTIFNQKINNS